MSGHAQRHPEVRPAALRERVDPADYISQHACGGSAETPAGDYISQRPPRPAVPFWKLLPRSIGFLLHLGTCTVEKVLNANSKCKVLNTDI